MRYGNVEDLVHRMQLTYDEIIDILDLKYIPTKRTGFSLNPNIYNVVDINNILENILPDNVKINITIDEKSTKLFQKLIKRSSLNTFAKLGTFANLGKFTNL